MHNMYTRLLEELWHYQIIIIVALVGLETEAREDGGREDDSSTYFEFSLI